MDGRPPRRRTRHLLSRLTCRACRGDFKDGAQPFVEPVGGAGVLRGEAREGVALRYQPALAGPERLFGSELVADVLEDGEDGGLRLPGDKAGGGEHPARFAVLTLDSDPNVVCPTIAPEPFGQFVPAPTRPRRSRLRMIR